MLKNFNQFITEARGFSTTVEEYAQVCKTLINATLDKYIAANRTEFTNFSKSIILKDAYLEVSQEAATKFPLDQIKILFEISAVDEEEFIPYAAHYQRNYNKVKLIEGKGVKVKIDMLCKFVVPKTGGQIDRAVINKYLDDILNHELTHAYNDYKDPNFFKEYRLGMTTQYAAETYPYLMKSRVLKLFFDLLYVLTPTEIKAIAGERSEFKSQEELREYSGYRWSQLARDFDPDEYYEIILSQIEDRRFVQYIDTKFGEFFVNVYVDSVHQDSATVDPKILRLKKSAGLMEVLRFFEQRIHKGGQELFRKLAAKVTDQGSGKLI